MEQLFFVDFLGQDYGNTIKAVPGPVPGPGPWEKAEPIPKFTVWFKNSFLKKFEGADFKYDNSFLKI